MSLSPLRTNYFTTLAPHVTLDMELKLLKVNILLKTNCKLLAPESIST